MDHARKITAKPGNEYLCKGLLSNHSSWFLSAICTRIHPEDQIRTNVFLVYISTGAKLVFKGVHDLHLQMAGEHAGTS